MIKKIIQKPKTIISKAYQLFRELLKLPYAKRYIALSLFLTILFAIITFPYEALIRKQLSKLEGNAVAGVSVAGLSFSVFDVAYFNNLQILFKDASQMNMRDTSINISINPFRIFINNRYNCDFQITGLKYTKDSTQIDCSASGNLSIKIDSKTGVPVDGFVKIMVQNAIIKIENINLGDQFGGLPLTLPGIKIPAIAFDSKITDGKMNISKMSFSGSQLKGDVTGIVTFDKFMQNSKLNLNISLDTESESISKFKDFIGKYIDKSNRLGISVEGTIANPRFSLKAL